MGEIDIDGLGSNPTILSIPSWFCNCKVLFLFFKDNLKNSDNHTDTQHDICDIENREIEYLDVDKVSYAS